MAPRPQRRHSAWALGLVGALELGCPVDQGSDDSGPDSPVPEPDKALSPDVSPRPQRHEPAVPRVREASREEAEDIARLLRREIGSGATEDGFPWALAHGLLAFGSTLKTSTGRMAVDAIAEHARTVEVAGRKVFRFPEATPAGRPIEPHPNMIAHTFASVGIPPTRTLTTSKGQKFTFERLVRDAAWAFQLPKDPNQVRGLAWSAILLMTAYPPSGHFVTFEGPLEVQALALETLGHLESEQSFLAALMSQGNPDGVVKRRQGIFAHACGGLHLVQAGVMAGRLGEPTVRVRVRRQLEVLKFRWKAERRIYRRTLAENPRYLPLLLIQELKFFGHALETFALAARWKATELTPGDRVFFQRVTSDLARTVEQLAPVYAAQNALRKINTQAYHDLIGDACHAIRALDIGIELFFREDDPPRPD